MRAGFRADARDRRAGAVADPGGGGCGHGAAPRRSPGPAGGRGGLDRGARADDGGGIAVDDPDRPRCRGALPPRLRRALEELGGAELRVSESARARGGPARAAGGPRLGEDARAAELMRRLLAAGAVRPVAPQASDRLTGRPRWSRWRSSPPCSPSLQAQAADPAGIAASVAISPTRSRRRSAARLGWRRAGAALRRVQGPCLT